MSYRSISQLADQFLYEPYSCDTTPLPPGTCTACRGLGTRLESIDDERREVRVPCYACQRFCRACKEYRKKDHVCPVRERERGEMHVDAGLNKAEQGAWRRLTDGK